MAKCFADEFFIKVSTEYPPACWWDESGSPEGEAKVLALNGRILV